jgi:hypothetical protein
VGKACAVGFFVFGTYVVQNGDGHNGRAVVLVQDDMEAIFQVVFFKGYLGLSRIPQGACRQKECVLLHGVRVRLIFTSPVPQELNHLVSLGLSESVKVQSLLATLNGPKEKNSVRFYQSWI